MRFRGDRSAFGSPGIEPRWTQGNKEGVGTSPFPDSPVWFTLWRGVLTEVYYPLVDHPQLRDLQFLVSDGKSFFHEEKRHLNLKSHAERSKGPSLDYRVTSADPEGRYRIDKEILTDPHLPVVLERARLVRAASAPPDLSIYVLAAPHLDAAGWGNNAFVVELAGRELLVAEHNGTWLALGASAPFRRLSCGYVGQSDGWTDISEHLAMTYEFDRALDGNIALTGELDLRGGDEFTLGLAFGQGLASAAAALLQSLGVPFEEHLRRTGPAGRPAPRACARTLGPRGTGATSGTRACRSSGPTRTRRSSGLGSPRCRSRGATPIRTTIAAATTSCGPATSCRAARASSRPGTGTARSTRSSTSPRASRPMGGSPRTTG